MDEYEWVNHYILFQEVHWIIDWPVLYFGVISFENIALQFIEIIIHEKLPYGIHKVCFQNITHDDEHQNKYATGESNV